MTKLTYFFNKKYFSIFLLVLLLAACTQKKQGYKLEEIKSCNFPDNPSEAAPMWVCNLKIDGYPITGIGSVKNSKAGIQFMTQQAAAHARVAISQELRTKVSNEITNYMESKDLGDEETIQNISKSVTSQITESVLIGSKVLRAATSSNGVMYVLVGLNPENYQKKKKNAFNKAIPSTKNILSTEHMNKMSEQIINNQ